MRLLLVEDDRDLVTALQKPLNNAGYAIDIAEDGVEGEYLGNENIYDIAILDMQLPHMDGKTLGSKIKEDADLAATKARAEAAMEAASEEEMAEEGEEEVAKEKDCEEDRENDKEEIAKENCQKENHEEKDRQEKGHRDAR